MFFVRAVLANKSKITASFFLEGKEMSTRKRKRTDINPFDANFSQPLVVHLLLPFLTANDCGVLAQVSVLCKALVQQRLVCEPRFWLKKTGGSVAEITEALDSLLDKSTKVIDERVLSREIGRLTALHLLFDDLVW